MDIEVRMTIQENVTASNRPVRCNSDPEKKGSPRFLAEETARSNSYPTVIGTVSPLDLTSAKKIQKKIVESSDADHSSSLRVSSLSRSIFKSPRALLREKRERVAKQKLSDRERKLSDRERKLSIEEILKKCPSRDKISRAEPMSLEDLSKTKLDISKYKQMKMVRRSRSRSFNKNFLATVQSTLNSGHLQPIDEAFINDYVKANVGKKIDAFLNAVGDFSEISSAGVEQCCLIIADKLYKELCNKNMLYTYVYRNLLSLKVIIGTELEKDKWNCRSEWLDDLVQALEFMLCSGSFTTPHDKMAKSTVESLNFYETFLKKHVQDASIRTLLHSAIHPNEELAMRSLERLSFWGSDEGYCEMVNQVRSAMQMYMNHQHVQNKTTLIKECFFAGGLLKNVDFEQVARSYIMHKKRNHAVLKVNDRDISDNVVKGGTQKKCQQQFFQSFLKILYKEGFLENASDEFILQQAQTFLSGKEFVGQEILLAGSNSAWAICDSRFRKMYPLLFNETYKTRMKQGTECYIQVESQDKYSIQVNKTYTTYPQPPGVNSRDSFAIDHSRPLCSIQVSWQIDYDAKKGWSHTISTPSVQRKKATDKEWEELLNILLAPTPIEGSTAELPESDQLKNALKFIL